MLYNDKFTIVANWKMNPDSYQQAQNLFENYLHITNLQKINLIVAVPYIYLGLLSNINQDISPVALSAQNLSAFNNGAVTAEISASMLKNFSINYSIIGHSECRYNYQEKEELINKKFILALKHQINPIICIGESKQQFDAGELVIEQHLIAQLEHIVKAINNTECNQLSIFIAYEPIWAIGSNVALSNDYIEKKCKFITDYIGYWLDKNINCYVLYGGNVSNQNIDSISNIKGLSGVLVGRNSLDIVKFAEICRKSGDKICKNHIFN